NTTAPITKQTTIPIDSQRSDRIQIIANEPRMPERSLSGSHGVGHRPGSHEAALVTPRDLSLGPIGYKYITDVKASARRNDRMTAAPKIPIIGYACANRFETRKERTDEEGDR
ncbi:MAG: hypothetical protein ACQERM_13065, partial [Methanobacteriota archaeon]